MNEFSRILIVGAGEAGEALFRELPQTIQGAGVIAFADDDTHKIGTAIEGVPVKGPLSQTGEICRELRITDIILAIPSASADLLSSIVSGVASLRNNINISIIPSPEKFFDSVPIFPSVREFDYSSLLDRDQFSIDQKLMANFFRGKTVLVTGAGGSIGSEICRQLFKFNVKKIVASGRGENSIYNLTGLLDKYGKLMKGQGPEVNCHIADVRNRESMERIFIKEKPDIIFHAAAHKHVPLMESNEAEALQNNVLGTNNILSLSREYGAENFVLVSTDKAVRPTSVMGATKRIAELLTGFYQQHRHLKTAVVRFGNVLGSRGSVIPLFEKQIQAGGPVTVTDPDVTRYFMSIPEASLLVINSAAISAGGEIFVLNMGRQYRIKDIAEKMIRLNGSGSDIRIEYTGLRPGEKLYEELFYNSEGMNKTGNDNIFVLAKDSENLSEEQCEELIRAVNEDVFGMDSRSVRQFIKNYVKEYNPATPKQ